MLEIAHLDTGKQYTTFFGRVGAVATDKDDAERAFRAPELSRFRRLNERVEEADGHLCIVRLVRSACRLPKSPYSAIVAVEQLGRVRLEVAEDLCA